MPHSRAMVDLFSNYLFVFVKPRCFHICCRLNHPALASFPACATTNSLQLSKVEPKTSQVPANLSANGVQLPSL